MRVLDARIVLEATTCRDQVIPPLPSVHSNRSRCVKARVTDVHDDWSLRRPKNAPQAIEFPRELDEMVPIDSWWARHPGFFVLATLQDVGKQRTCDGSKTAIRAVAQTVGKTVFWNRWRHSIPSRSQIFRMWRHMYSATSSAAPNECRSLS